MRDLTDQTEKNILCSYLNPNSLVLEIGSYDGASASAMADVALDVFCIDPFLEDHTLGSVIRPSLGSFIATTKGKENIHLFYGKDRDILPLLKDDVFNFVFVDGLHTYGATLFDLFHGYRVLKNGGYIALHDFEFPEVTRAATDWLETIPAIPDKQYLERLYVWKKSNG